MQRAQRLREGSLKEVVNNMGNEVKSKEADSFLSRFCDAADPYLFGTISALSGYLSLHALEEYFLKRLTILTVATNASLEGVKESFIVLDSFSGYPGENPFTYGFLFASVCGLSTVLTLKSLLKNR